MGGGVRTSRSPHAAKDISECAAVFKPQSPMAKATGPRGGKIVVQNIGQVSRCYQANAICMHFGIDRR